MQTSQESCKLYEEIIFQLLKYKLNLKAQEMESIFKHKLLRIIN